MTGIPPETVEVVEGTGSDGPRSRPRARTGVLRWITVLASTLITLAILEVAVRLIHPVPLHPTDTFLVKDFVTGREGSMTLVPGAVARLTRSEFDTQVRINSRGLRDREIPYEKPAGIYRILVLGDSQTFGFGVESEETYAKVLERRLSTRRPTETINSGVPGAGTAHELNFLETEGWKYHPDAVVVGFFFNDPLENKQCRLYAWDGGRLVRPARPAGEAHLLRKVLDLPESQNEIQAVRAPVLVPPRPSFLIRHSHLARLLRESVSNIAQVWRPEPLSAGHPQEFTAHLLGEIARQCRERDVRLLVVMIPWRGECADVRISSMSARYARSLKKLDHPDEQVLDLLPAIRKKGYNSLLFNVDQHLTPAGHAWVAAEIERALLRQEPRLRSDHSR